MEQKEQLTAATSACGTEPRPSQVSGLEEELQRVKEDNQQKEKSLLEQIESLQQQLKHKVCSLWTFEILDCMILCKAVDRQSH